MSDIAIKVEGLGKEYIIGHQKQGDLMNSFSAGWKRLFQKSKTKESFWALKDLNFEIRKGEAVGIIGRNGAGKSTLLKILSRITEPTKGRFEINGRVSSLLEVGTGFHPELTGRENIYLNGTILGMNRKEIKQKFDEIVAFSGVEKFLDTPVKHYSSGMKVRLAFSVAAHLEPEILIIDEVLAVGDAEFQKKCLGKMDEVSKGEGRTVIFVSHNMGAVQNLCQKGIVLERGTAKSFDKIEEALEGYLESLKSNSRQKIEERVDRGGNGKVRIADLILVNGRNDLPTESVSSGDEVLFKIKYLAREYKGDSIKEIQIGLAIFNSHEQFVTVLNNKMANFTFIDAPVNGELVCKISRLPLMFGDFTVKITLLVDGEVSDRIDNAFNFYVNQSDFYKSGVINVNNRQGVYVDQSWNLVASVL